MRCSLVRLSSRTCPFLLGSFPEADLAYATLVSFPFHLPNCFLGCGRGFSTVGWERLYFLPLSSVFSTHSPFCGLLQLSLIAFTALAPVSFVSVTFFSWTPPPTGSLTSPFYHSTRRLRLLPFPFALIGCSTVFPFP